LKKNKVPKTAPINGLEVVLIPAVLRKLNILERRFVCQIQTYLTLLNLPAGGQYAQKGLAIHFASEPSDIIQSLPVKPANAGIVCLSGKTACYVRPHVILAALHWLKKHNHLYNNINICYDVFGTDEQELESLQEEVEQTGLVPIEYEAPRITPEQFLKQDPTSSFGMQRSSGYPVSMSDKKHSDCLAFPWLFPTGTGDFHSQRDVKLDYLNYAKSRILHRNPRFRTDISFLIVTLNRYETQLLNSQLSFYLGRVRKAESVSFSQLQNLSMNPDLAANSLMYMSNIRGTPAYWKDKLGDLLAKLKALGPPIVFMTLSVDDIGGEDIQAFLKLDLEQDYESPEQAVRKDPVAVALYCQKKIKSFIQYLKTHDNILGPITDYHVRMEFQNRGTVHFHIFFWIDKAPGKLCFPQD
jgi:hypothetical protein